MERSFQGRGNMGKRGLDEREISAFI